MAGSDALRDRLLSRIQQGTSSEISEEEFGALALDIFAHQYARNPTYRAFCERRSATPETVQQWTEIPAVPTDAFKAVPLLCGDRADAVAVFQTSGTTAGRERRGKHYFLDLSLYDAALRAGFRAHLLPGGARLPILSLIPSPAEQPDSSLSHMIDEVVREFGAPESTYYVDQNGIDTPRLLVALRQAEQEDTPVLIPGTSFAFVHLLDALAEGDTRIALPRGSRIMDTGGFKGRSREVSREELYREFTERLGVPPAWCVNEYGMTEMSSQFYDAVVGEGAGSINDRRYQSPPWVRTQAVDPETLAPVPEGGVGVLRHWDLANLDSVMALQTADLGRILPDGIQLLGRARGAEARGCSIAMDELLDVVQKSESARVRE